MKNSLIPKKNLIPGQYYWCTHNNYSVLLLLKYIDKDIFQENEQSEIIRNVRVMYEGYVNINKSRIPKNYLVPKRHYWCRFRDENKLILMRYENDQTFYSISHDVFWPSSDVKVIFEDYEENA